MKKKKVMFISSSGGHFNELLQLKPLFDKYDYHIVTEKIPSKNSLKETYPHRINFLIYGSRYHFITYPFKLFLNCWISLFLYIKVRPKVIITTGSHTAGPMCCLGKIFGSKIIFIESYANVKTKTLTGKVIYKFADLFLVQWPNMLRLYPKAKYVGRIF